MPENCPLTGVDLAFCGCMRERVNVRSPVLENGTPGSVRGASGNWRPYLDSVRTRRFKISRICR